jgi:eukaryotic-like serine/threonine-protein kinase
MTLTSGARLGPYEIVAPLGAGGMGEVYRARDTRLKREVAIKVLPQALSLDAERLRRFEQEALATAALNHPNILAVFDIGSQEGAPYVVSELLEGETLRDRLRGGSIAIRKTLDYALQIAHGLAAAHEKGIIHRDLKPENLFLTKDGRVKILDFGLAKLTQPDPSAQTSLATMTQATEAGAVMGTAGYMSPEQVRGVVVDPRSDIFAFGAILYEMVSGKRAFHRDTPADTMSAILKEDPPELSETNRNVSPALERIVQHCLEKNPEQRFHSARDIAFDLEHLTGVSGTTARASATAAPTIGRRRARVFAGIAIGLAFSAILFGLGWKTGRATAAVAQPEYKQVTFRTGSIGHARFTPDGNVVYSAAWDSGDSQLYIATGDDPGARELGIKDAELLSISKNGELAIRLRTRFFGGYARTGTLARVLLSGGTPREVMDNVQDVDWAPDGQNMAAVSFVPANGHWRLEYPIGKVLFDSINWISHPKISPDGKWVAFADHENPTGDDEGTVAVISADGKGEEKKLSSGWESLEGILWSPASDEIWFSSNDTGSALNPRAVNLSGKLRTITKVPGGMWLEDFRNGKALMVTHQIRLGIRGLAPGAKQELELGWFGWSIARDISRDGHKVLFEEEGDGGGPNYTVYLRDTDGSPPTQIGEGLAKCLSPDSKWAITQPAKGGPLMLVPTGAGATHPLTHDSVRYGRVHWLPDGKQLLAAGIEAGHGRRDYLIDVATGDSKPITPEGIFGADPSPDGRSTIARGPNGIGILSLWPLEGGGGLRLIPNLPPSFSIVGWSPDGKSVYASDNGVHNTVASLYRVDPVTGKMDHWKTFGAEAGTGIADVGWPEFSADGSAYAYVYDRTLSQAYIVTGLK